MLEHRVRALPPASDDARRRAWSTGCSSRRSTAARTRCCSTRWPRRGQLREGDEHLAATARPFESEGQDWAPLGQAWRAAKSRHAGMPVALSAGEAFVLPVAASRAC